MSPATPLTPRVWLFPDADRLIRREARARRFVETGGPLFGYFDPESGDAVIVEARGPGPEAKHRPRALIPDLRATQQAMDDVHARSQGAWGYVGEWHTHPGGTASPSQRDIGALAAISDDRDTDLAEPLALIVATIITRPRVQIRSVAAFRWRAESRTAQALVVHGT